MINGYNRYAGDCHYCGNNVPAKAGKLLGKVYGSWRVAHLACDLDKSARVVETYFPNTGNRVYRNSNGRCEDAPCCGCCS